MEYNNNNIQVRASAAEMLLASLAKEHTLDTIMLFPEYQQYVAWMKKVMFMRAKGTLNNSVIEEYIRSITELATAVDPLYS